MSAQGWTRRPFASQEAGAGLWVLISCVLATLPVSPLYCSRTSILSCPSPSPQLSACLRNEVRGSYAGLAAAVFSGSPWLVVGWPTSGEDGDLLGSFATCCAEEVMLVSPRDSAMCCGLHMWTCDLRLVCWPVTFSELSWHIPLPAACGLVLSLPLSVMSLSWEIAHGIQHWFQVSLWFGSVHPE